MAAAKGNRYSAKFTDKEMNVICENILDWAFTSKEIYISSYIYKNYKKAKNWLHCLAAHYPQMAETLDIVRDITAAKLANHSFIGDRNSTFGEKLLPMYCKDYKALLKWKAEISKEQPVKEDNKGAFNEWSEEQKKKKADEQKKD